MTIEKWLGKDNTLGKDVFTHKYLFTNEDGTTETVMNDKYCSECNSFVEQEIIGCDNNNAKCLWLLSLILLMNGDDGFCSGAERREDG